uniref:Pollen coat protein n=1 Tax=Glycine max TaxID=3847 RepID=K7LXQ9_SOYBN
MDSQNMSYNAGQAKAKLNFFMCSMILRTHAQASSAAQSAQNSMQQAGQQMQAKAQGAADAVKNATGMNN